MLRNKSFIYLFRAVFIIFVLVNNYGCSVNENYIRHEESKNVTATGYGDNKQNSLENAFDESLKKAFGSRVHTEERVSDRTLVKNEISVTDIEKEMEIKDYKILEESEKAGLYTTKINAQVIAIHRIELARSEKGLRKEWNQLTDNGENYLFAMSATIVKNLVLAIPGQFYTWFSNPKKEE